MKEMVWCFMIALVIGATINGFTPGGGASAPPAAEQTPMAGGSTADATNIQEVSDANFQADVIKSSKPVLVDFYATWCGPCKQMDPIVETVASEYSDKLKVVKVDVDANAALSAKYNIGSIPSFVLFKDGKVAEFYAGAMDKSELVSIINKQVQ